MRAACIILTWACAACGAAGALDLDASARRDPDAAPSAPDASPPVDAGADADAGAPDAANMTLPRFSFFLTSLETMQRQSGSPNGFGGNLGGLAGADAICQRAAAEVGFGAKTWRAFLSVFRGPNGAPVHAIDRIGDGPWYDFHGRLVAMDRAGLLQTRPAGDPAVMNDLPDENGVGLKASFQDAHDIMTGSNPMGMLDGADASATCNDWTSSVGPGSENKVRCGHAWPAMSGMHWIHAHRLPGCGAGVRTTFTPPGQQGDTVGGQGGWGGIYCFALTP